MKYQVEIEIDKPLEKVVELFKDPDNAEKWMVDLKSLEHLSGTPGKVGAKSRLKFEMGKRKIEMIETITVDNLPSEFAGTYETDGVYNIVSNRFSQAGEGRTRWVSHNEFQFTTFGMKMMGFFMPGAFKKESLKYLENFKKFAEESADKESAGAGN